jgi:perosamine synthetase
MIPVSRPLISEDDIKAVSIALESTLISGDTPPVKSLEESLGAYIGTSEAIAVSSGTSAIDLVVEALDLAPGCKAVLPNFTIISSASQLLRRGYEIIAIDADPNTWCMDAELTNEALEEDPALVMPVHIYGMPVDVDVFWQKAKDKEIKIIEDAAEALGLKYKDKMCGNLGDAAVFSFYANKIVTGGEGGAVVTNSTELAQEIRLLRNLHHSPEERFVHSELGWNTRMHGLSAALANSQMGRIDQLIQQKQKLANLYLEGLQGHPWLSFQSSTESYATNVYWVFGAVLNSESPFDAPGLRNILRNHEIDTRRFFCPLSLQPLASKYPIKKFGSMKISENLWERGLYFPSGLGITTNEVERVIDILWKITK